MYSIPQTICIFAILSIILRISIARPAMQRIIINNHEWEVPNEPGWDKVIKEADLVHQRYSKCLTATECRKIAEEIRGVFNRHEVSRRYLESNKDEDEGDLSLIFKWG